MFFYYNTDYSLAFNVVANTFVAIGIVFVMVFVATLVEKVVRYFR